MRCSPRSRIGLSPAGGRFAAGRLTNGARFLAIAMLAVGGASARPVLADENAGWLAGAAMRTALDRPVSVAWSGATLAASLDRLSHSTRVKIVLDRRVDPGRKLDLTLSGQPLHATLDRLAEQQGLVAAQLDGIVYLGPERAAKLAPTVSALCHEQAARVPAARKRVLVERRPWSWEALTTPRELLAGLERESGLKIERADLVPHDLWRAAELPSLAWIDRLLLVAIQFDLRPELTDDSAVRLVPLDDETPVRRSYPGQGRAGALAAQWRSIAPAAKIETDRDHVVVTASIDDHRRLGERAAAPADRPSEKRPSGKPSRATETYQLAVENVAVRRLLGELAERLRLEFDYDEAALKQSGRSLDRLVTFNVKDATLDQLLSAALGPAGLTYRRDDRRVKITAADGR